MVRTCAFGGGWRPMSDPSQDAPDLRDPGWFPHDIDLNSGRAGYVRTDRATLSAEPFLDHRWLGAEAVSATASLAGLDAVVAEPPQMSFIWHTSHCASTLLAACLDSPGRCLALKEPRVLVILAALKQSGRLRDPGAARAVFGLLGRRFDPAEQVLVKPSNGANGLIAEAAELTRGRALLMYSDCESFVLSMARRGRSGFAYVRDRFRNLAADGHPASRWPAADLFRLTDLEMTGLVWRMQMDVLEAASARLGERARSLDCSRLLADPASVLTSIDQFLGLGLGPERIGRVVAGPLLARDAKQPGVAFDAAARAEQDDHIRRQLGADLPAVLESIAAMTPRPSGLAPSIEAEWQEGSSASSASPVMMN
jgi:hypothetical protein